MHYHWYAATRFASCESVWTTAGNELNCPVSTTSVISACGRLMHYVVNISGALIRTHDLWIRKRVCYQRHHSASHSTNVTLPVKSHTYSTVLDLQGASPVVNLWHVTLTTCQNSVQRNWTWLQWLIASYVQRPLCLTCRRPLINWERLRWLLLVLQTSMPLHDKWMSCSRG